MEDEDYKRYVCVEPGCVDGVTTVEVQKELTLKQTIMVEELWSVCWKRGKEEGEWADNHSRLNTVYAIWDSESRKGSRSFFEWALTEVEGINELLPFSSFFVLPKLLSIRKRILLFKWISISPLSN